MKIEIVPPGFSWFTLSKGFGQEPVCIPTDIERVYIDDVLVYVCPQSGKGDAEIISDVLAHAGAA